MDSVSAGRRIWVTLVSMGIGTRTTVGQLLAAMKGEPHADPPIEALAALVHSLIVLLPPDAEGAMELDELVQVRVRVDGQGSAELDGPVGLGIDSAGVVELLRQQLAGQVLPASLARLLLASPVPDLERVEAVVGELASAAALARVAATAPSRSASRGNTGAAASARGAAAPSRSASRADAGAAATFAQGAASVISRSASRGDTGAAAEVRAGGGDSEVRLVPAEEAPKARLRWVLMLALGLAGAWLGLSTLISTGTQAHGEPPADTAVPASAPPVTAPIVRGPDWTDVLTRLDNARNQALESGDPDRLNEVNAPNSQAAAQDRKLIEDLDTAGVRPVGMSMQLLSVHPVEETATTATLQVRDIRSAYQLVPRDNRSADRIERRPARSAQDWTVRLHLVAGNWRVAQVTQDGE